MKVPTHLAESKARHSPRFNKDAVTAVLHVFLSPEMNEMNPGRPAPVLRGPSCQVRQTYWQPRPEEASYARLNALAETAERLFKPQRCLDRRSGGVDWAEANAKSQREATLNGLHTGKTSQIQNSEETFMNMLTFSATAFTASVLFACHENQWSILI